MIPGEKLGQGGFWWDLLLKDLGSGPTLPSAFCETLGRLSPVPGPAPSIKYDAGHLELPEPA